MNDQDFPAPSTHANFTGSKSIAENKADPVALARHRRKCQVCHHPEREMIEREYRDWFGPLAIARSYGIPERALFRHLEATGLTSSRRKNLRSALERILERGVETEIDGPTIIQAVRAYCCLNDGNKWVEPVKDVTFSNRQCHD
jgi:hypothetical protein